MRAARARALGRSPEVAVGLAILAAGLGLRLWFVHAFPTRPISDFLSLVDFAKDLLLGRTRGGWYWRWFNPGLPLQVVPFLALLPLAHADAARLATAIACGLMGLVPFLCWRGVLPLWVRATAGLALAVWPGQVLFTGVVAQDNWVLPWTVLLGSLAVRSLLTRDGHPLLAALAYLIALATRDEMLVVLLPLAAIAAVGTWPVRAKALLLFAVTVAAGMLALSTLRWHETGRFALLTSHGGTSILGSYVPGAAASFWADPRPFVAAVQPRLLDDDAAFGRQAYALALRELLRRPRFHLERMATMAVTFVSEAELLGGHWSLSAEVMPPERRAAASRFLGAAQRPLRLELAIIAVLTLTAAVVGWRSRSVPVLALLGTAAGKLVLHLVTVAQGRYLLACIALALLAIPLAAAQACSRRDHRRAALVAMVLAGLGVAAAIRLQPVLRQRLRREDVDRQRTYGFELALPRHRSRLRCSISEGRPAALERPQTVTLALPWTTRDPGGKAVARLHCDVERSLQPRDDGGRVRLLVRATPAAAAGESSDQVLVTLGATPAWRCELAAALPPCTAGLTLAGAIPSVDVALTGSLLPAGRSSEQPTVTVSLAANDGASP